MATRISNIFLGRLACSLLVALSSTNFALAATFNWDGGGGGDTNWYTVANWDGNGVPTNGGGSVDINSGTRTVSVSSNVEIGGGDFATGGIVTLNISGAEFKVNNNAFIGTRAANTTTNINLTNGATWFQNAAGLVATDFQGVNAAITNVFIDGTSSIVRNTTTNLNASFEVHNNGRLFITMEAGSQIAFGDLYLRQSDPDQVSVLQGAGDVILSRTGADQFRNTGRVEANGGILNLDYVYTMMGANQAGFSETMTGGIHTGYYASNGGTLRMPDVILGGNVRSWGNRHDAGVDTLPLIGSLQMTGSNMAGTVDVELLALDHPSVMPGLVNPLGVWRMSELVTTSGVTGLTLHYDDFLAADLLVDEADLLMFYNDGSGWVDITSSIITGSDLIKGSISTFNGQFAVATAAVPEPSSLVLAGLGLLGLAGHLVRRRK